MTYFIFDGYDFGDRTLEGVPFKAILNDTQDKVVKVELYKDSNKAYFETLNQKMWLKKAKLCAEDLLENELDELEIKHD